MEGLALGLLVVAGWALVVALRQRIRVATYFGIAYAGFFAGSIMWFIWNFARPTRCAYLGRVAVMGKRQGIGMYEVIDGDPPERLAAKRATAEAFAGAVTAFVAGSFAEAAERFAGVLRADDADGAARYLHGRAIELAASDAPWEGVDQAAK